MTDPRDTMQWVWRGSALAALAIGWGFIAWQNQFHISAPVVFICLGYLAVIATVYNLWRTGAAAVANEDVGGDSTWAKPVGALGELEREKRTLLKAIKEAEFDLQMGKLSQRDADEMIRTYRARAIEVIKDIDRLGQGSAGSTREQILREVRARLELEAKSPAKAKKAAKADAGDGKRKTKPAKDVAAPSEPEAPDVAEPSEADVAAAEAAAQVAARTSVRHEDETLDADSTTAIEPKIEPKRDDPGKVATP